MTIQNIDEHQQTGWQEDALKIITHDGTFHSDEIFSIGLLLKFERNENQPVQIVRSRNEDFLKQHRSIAEVFILDIGGDYNAGLHNFDHHQDNEYFKDKAAVRLVYDYLLNSQKMEANIGNHLWENLLKLINKWDLGEEQKFVNYYHRPLPSLISSYNRTTEDLSEENIQFEKALRFGLEIIENEIFSYQQYQDAKRTFLQHRNINSHTIIFESFNPKHSSFLKQYRNIRYYIYPYKGNWAVGSVNSKKFPLPDCEHCEHLVFSHKNHFLTVFDSKEAAIRFMEPKFQGKI
ncbi:MAG: hypothetical protein DSY76_01145 [Bacteroidetes bacterium]|nr:MAG: hypothetical protein DSY76_01145 [Bacteroidota bacterium]